MLKKKLEKNSNKPPGRKKSRKIKHTSKRKQNSKFEIQTDLATLFLQIFTVILPFESENSTTLQQIDLFRKRINCVNNLYFTNMLQLCN